MARPHASQEQLVAFKERSGTRLTTIIIDGFMSIAQRTTLQLDPDVNVVFGLRFPEGWHIPAAILFAMGCRDLSRLRVASLDDVVYRSGQMRLKKAAVTLVFHNSNP